MKRGSKYDEALSDAGIAKRIRQDITLAVKASELPRGLKVSVRCEGGRTCSAIDVRVTAVPEGFRVMEADCSGWPSPGYRLTTEMARVIGRLQDIMDAYNYDDSKIEYDHFDRRFYGHAALAGNLRAEAVRKVGEGDYEMRAAFGVER